MSQSNTIVVFEKTLDRLITSEDFRGFCLNFNDNVEAYGYCNASDGLLITAELEYNKWFVYCSFIDSKGAKKQFDSGDFCTLIETKKDYSSGNCKTLAEAEKEILRKIDEELKVIGEMSKALGYNK
jgi:hypothetical protein